MVVTWWLNGGYSYWWVMMNNVVSDGLYRLTDGCYLSIVISIFVYHSLC